MVRLQGLIESFERYESYQPYQVVQMVSYTPILGSPTSSSPGVESVGSLVDLKKFYTTNYTYELC